MSLGLLTLIIFLIGFPSYRSRLFRPETTRRFQTVWFLFFAVCAGWTGTGLVWAHSMNLNVAQGAAFMRKIRSVVEVLGGVRPEIRFVDSTAAEQLVRGTPPLFWIIAILFALFAIAVVIWGVLLVRRRPIPKTAHYAVVGVPVCCFIAFWLFFDAWTIDSYKNSTAHFSAALDAAVEAASARGVKPETIVATLSKQAEHFPYTYEYQGRGLKSMTATIRAIEELR